MNPIVPSPHLLRQLAVACRSSPSTPRTCTNCSLRTLHTQTHTNSSSSRPVKRRTAQLAPQHRSTSTSSTTTSTSTSTATPTPPAPSTTPNISNHYTLFPLTLPLGAPPRGPFHIPLPLLRREFLAIQALHHPDKHQHSSPTTATESPNPQRSALALSSLINTAYKTLSDPLLRAQYLLHHTYGIDVSAEDNSTHASDPETLMQVLDAQERIEDARTQAEIDEIRAENAKRVADTVEELGRAFERDDPAAATRECVRLRYWRSLGEGLHDWEPGKEVRLTH